MGSFDAAAGAAAVCANAGPPSAAIRAMVDSVVFFMGIDCPVEVEERTV
jgi:hypothetical protein